MTLHKRFSIFSCLLLSSAALGFNSLPIVANAQTTELWSTEMIYSNVGYGSVGQTDYNVQKATSNDFYKKNPTVNNLGDIAWEGYPDVVNSRGSEIYLRYGGSSVATRLTNNNVRDYAPRLNDLGDLVWYGGLGGVYDIFLHSGGTTSQITTNGQDNILPQINNNSDIVWQGRDNTIEQDYEIFLYSGSSSLTKQVTTNSWSDKYPKINDLGAIVWQGSVDNTTSGWEIFLNSDGENNQQLTSDDLQDFGPQINSNNDLVWEVNDGNDWEIIVKYSDNLEPLQLTDNDTDDWYPKMNDNGVITWQGHDGNDWEIFYFSPSTPGIVYQVTDNTSDDQYPQINSNGDIAWHGSGSDTGIHLFEADTQLVHTLSDAIMAGGFYDSIPSINDQGKVTWYGWDGNSFEIFVGTPPETVHDDIYFFPQRLNLQSRGQGFTMFVNFKGEVPVIQADQINGPSIRMTMVNNVQIDGEGIAPLEGSEFEIVDFDDDGILDMKVKFDRQEIITAIKATMGDVSRATMVDLNINGLLLDGRDFYGNESIKVTNGKISKVKKSRAIREKIAKAGKSNKGKWFSKINKKGDDRDDDKK